MPKLTPELIAELERLNAEATPAPWRMAGRTGASAELIVLLRNSAKELIAAAKYQLRGGSVKWPSAD